jgi:hypothetical protein
MEKRKRMTGQGQKTWEKTKEEGIKHKENVFDDVSVVKNLSQLK